MGIFRINDGRSLSINGALFDVFVETGLPYTPPLDLGVDAYGAYGFARKLKTDYEGFAYNVTRTGDNAGLDIGFNEDGSVDTDSLTSFLGGGHGRLYTIYDQSGNGRNYTYPSRTDSKCPYVYQSGSPVTEGGFNAVRLDGLQAMYCPWATSQAVSFMLVQNLHSGDTGSMAMAQSGTNVSNFFWDGSTSVGSWGKCISDSNNV